MRLSIFISFFLFYAVFASPILRRGFLPSMPKLPSLPPVEAPAITPPKTPVKPPTQPVEAPEEPPTEPPAQVPVKPIPTAPKPPVKPTAEPTEPPAKTPTKAPAKTTAKPTATEPAESGKPATKTKTKTKAPTKLPNCPKKRGTNPVDEAVHSRTDAIGSGNTGFVYETTYEGQPAVVKVMDASSPGAGPDAVKKEVTNLKTVGQLLGWGEKKNENRDPGHFFYIVMPNMGGSAKSTGLSNTELGSLVQEAKTRYLNQYHMENKDMNPDNFVYRKVNGKWQAEIIDWARATYSGKTPQPSPGTPQEVTDPSKCTVQ